MKIRYRALVSSDWNECLAPCRPFDFISYAFPHLETRLSRIFKLYTGNHISLAEATRQIEQLLPRPVTANGMDAYLEQSFHTYNGVPELIEWCAERDILFMINTTGMVGYFQRALAGDFLPRVPVISAHPMIRYADNDSEVPDYIELREIGDKGRNTAAVADKYHIPEERIVILGDSGGDGPHFEWGSRAGAFLVGCMTKPSLTEYCRKKGIRIHLQFGSTNPPDNEAALEDEYRLNFMELAPAIDTVASR